MAPSRPPSHAPYLHRGWRYLELQFRSGVAQTRMLRWCPDWLLIGYTRTMLAALLLRPRPVRIAVIGLGGGAQAKFCHRHLRHSRIEVVENDPGVLALRGAFRIPADDARLAVEPGDGATWLRERTGRYDLLLVDAYDIDGIPPAIALEQRNARLDFADRERIERHADLVRLGVNAGVFVHGGLLGWRQV